VSVEIRDAGPGFWALSGMATTWSHPGSDRAYFVGGPDGMFLERMERGAFADAAGGREHVELRCEHRRDGPVYASTTGRTMRLADERDGLALAAALSKSDSATQTAVAAVRAGTLSGLSVGMTVRRDSWGTAQDGRTQLRTIHDAGLTEVSLVQRPANPQAKVLDVRHETRSGAIVEFRSVPLVLAARDDYTTEPCDTCLGRGTIPCPKCDGSGYTDTDSDEQQVTANVRRSRVSLAENDSDSLLVELWKLR
jgi:HK97 family phage prohead protease